MGNPLFLLFASEQKEGIAVLGIDPKAILLQAGTFIILFLIIKKFALKGIVDTLEKRRETIDKGVELGIEMEAEKAKFDESLQKMQQSARVEAEKIIAEAQHEAGEIIKAGEDAATQKVDGMLKHSSARIEREMENARQELQAEMLTLVSEATETIIQEKLDKTKDASLIQRALAKVRA